MNTRRREDDMKCVVTEHLVRPTSVVVFYSLDLLKVTCLLFYFGVLPHTRPILKSRIERGRRVEGLITVALYTTNIKSTPESRTRRRALVSLTFFHSTLFGLSY